METSKTWIPVCPQSSLAEGDVMRFDHQEKTFAVYHTNSGFYATAGFCTHDHVHLADGLVTRNEIECPMHQGIFDVRTGKALAAPACIDLQTYPVKIEQGQVYIQVDYQSHQ
jgi:3-phenylpropionate/trans-cinnamate dioxygenase ferredoxin component